jgi:hypothetical protein
MQLVMYLGNDFIASIYLNEQQLSEPGYMGRLKRRLMEENSKTLQYTSDKPEFLVVNISGTTSGSNGQTAAQ